MKRSVALVGICAVWIQVACSASNPKPGPAAEFCAPTPCGKAQTCVEGRCVDITLARRFSVVVTGSAVRGGDLALAYDPKSTGVGSRPQVSGTGIVAEAAGGRGVLRVAFAARSTPQEIEVAYFPLEEAKASARFSIVTSKLVDRAGNIVPGASVTVAQE